MMRISFNLCKQDLYIYIYIYIDKKIRFIMLYADIMLYQLKEASVTDASATPPAIGTREATTQKVGNCMRMRIIVRIETT